MMSPMEKVRRMFERFVSGSHLPEGGGDRIVLARLGVDSLPSPSEVGSGDGVSFLDRVVRGVEPIRVYLWHGGREHALDIPSSSFMRGDGLGLLPHFAGHNSLGVHFFGDLFGGARGGANPVACAASRHLSRAFRDYVMSCRAELGEELSARSGGGPVCRMDLEEVAERMGSAGRGMYRVFVHDREPGPDPVLSRGVSMAP